MKKFKIILLIATVLNVASAFAQGGTTGSLTWNFNATSGTLTISGEGEMPNYYYDPENSSGTTIPWRDYLSSINTVVIETGVTSIGNSAFHSCISLTSITIPNSVTSIGIWVFSNCTSLTSINVENGNNTYASEGGVLFNKSKSILIRYPEGKVGAYIIPNSVTNIGDYAFNNCTKLPLITIPNSVIAIGDNAFSNCTNLISITLPSSVTTIENGAFAHCTSLTLVIFPSSVTTIGNGAFIYCTNLTSITNLNPVPVAINPNVFNYVNTSKCTLEVPMESVSAYKNAEVWKKFKIVGIDVGIETVEADVVKIYPNPTTGQLKIENGELKIENIAIYDMMGQTVSYLMSHISHPISIDISNLPSGIYFIRIRTEAGIVTKKIVKID
jgi:putative transposon-encoded protein